MPRRGLKSIGDDYLTRSLRLIVCYSMQLNQEFPITSLSNPYVNELKKNKQKERNYEVNVNREAHVE